MLNEDEILDQKLNELENGAALADVLRDLPEDAQELKALISLAAALRSVPHPEPGESQVTAQRQQVLAAAVRNTQPVRNTPPAPINDTLPAMQPAVRYI